MRQRRSSMVTFATIEAAAQARHGREGVEARLPVPKSAVELRAMPDDRCFSLMSLRIFRAGLRHDLVDRKWPAFEEVFHGFAPARCATLFDEDIEAMLEDRRLIRHLAKLRAVRANAVAMLALECERGAFGAWLADWPVDDIVGLWMVLAKRFSQLGGNSAPAFLRMAGKDTFLLTDGVTRALLHWRMVDAVPRTRADRAAVQQLFNRWAAESGRPLCQLSQILALSAD